MFTKLLKYDLKSMLKTMIPLWIAFLVLSFLMGIQVLFETRSNWAYEADGLIDGLLVLALFAVFVAIIVLNILLIIQRFWNGLLKDEGYLMFTLPVSQRKLILSKAVSALLISLGSTVVAILAGLIIGGISLHAIQNIDLSLLMSELRYAMDTIKDTVTMSSILLSILSSILGFMNAIYHIYAAMAIGHLSNKNRFLWSVIAYIGISIIQYMFLVPLIDRYRLFINTTSLTTDMIVEAVFLLIEIVIYHVITELILTYRLNLE